MLTINMILDVDAESLYFSFTFDKLLKLLRLNNLKYSYQENAFISFFYTS